MISDLQSASGMRVNDKYYRKVELRHGDEIDLKYVRLRFVKAGEDFLLGRDAYITDVLERQRRSVIVRRVLTALLVLVSAVALFALLHVLGIIRLM